MDTWNILESKRSKIVLFVILSALFFIRVIYLDADLPNWGVLDYQPLDEGQYANMALNMINFGSINPNDYFSSLGYEYVTQSHILCDLLGNAMTYVTLLIFGDNYYGLRMSSIVASYLAFVFFLLTLENVYRAFGKREVKAKILALACAILLLASFMYYNSSRVQEPSSFRLLCIQLVLYIAVKDRLNHDLKAFLLGFITMFSILGVYPTNLFLVAMPFAYVILVCITDGLKKGLWFMLYGLMGAAIAYAVLSAYYMICWGTTPFANAAVSVFSFASVTEEGYGSTYNIGAIQNLLNNFVAFFISNVFLYIPALFGLLAFGTVLVLTPKKEREKRSLRQTCRNPVVFKTALFLAVVFAYILQTIVSQDFVTRKAIVVFPTMILIVYIAAMTMIDRAGGADKRKITIAFVVAALIAIAAIAVTIYERMFVLTSNTMTYLDFSSTDIKLGIIGGVVAGVLILLFAIFGMRSKRTTFNFLLVIIAVSCAFNILWTAKYDWIHPTFSDRDAQIALGQDAGDNIVAGTYVCSFTLYNDIKPLVNHRFVLSEYMAENPDLLFFDYSGGNAFERDSDSVYQHIFEKIRYSRVYISNRNNRDVSLYVSE